MKVAFSARVSSRAAHRVGSAPRLGASEGYPFGRQPPAPTHQNYRHQRPQLTEKWPDQPIRTTEPTRSRAASIAIIPRRFALLPPTQFQNRQRSWVVMPPLTGMPVRSGLWDWPPPRTSQLLSCHIKPARKRKVTSHELAEIRRMGRLLPCRPNRCSPLPHHARWASVGGLLE